MTFGSVVESPSGSEPRLEASLLIRTAGAKLEQTIGRLEPQMRKDNESGRMFANERNSLVKKVDFHCESSVQETS